MAQQRPRVVVQQLPPRVRPQIAMLVDYDAINGFGPQVKEMLGEFLGSFLFIDFCKVQVAKAEEKIKNLRPLPEWTTEEYFKLMEDMKLVCRFWADLLQFAEGFKQG